MSYMYYFCYRVREQYLFLKSKGLFGMLNFQFCCRGAARDFKPYSYGSIRKLFPLLSEYCINHIQGKNCTTIYPVEDRCAQSPIYQFLVPGWDF